MRSILPFVLLIGACGLERSSTDTGTVDSVQGVRQDLPGSGSSSSGSDDTGDTDDSGSGLPGDDTDTVDTDSGTATGPIDAWVYIFEDTSDVNVCLYGIANASTGDYSEYSSDYCSTSDGSKGNGWLMQPVTYTPGEVLVANGKWSDGTTNQRYLAEAGALLTNVKYILIVFPDDTYDQYTIGTSSEVGHAYIKDASGYHDWMIVTNTHTTGDYDL